MAIYVSVQYNGGLLPDIHYIYYTVDPMLLSSSDLCLLAGVLWEEKNPHLGWLEGMTRAFPTRVCVLGANGGGRAGVRCWFALFAGGTVGWSHRSYRGRDKNAVLALNIVGRGRSCASSPRMSRCPK